MASRYGYSREFIGPNGKEVFTVDSANSFDEAKKIVDRGIYDRELELQAARAAAPATPPVTAPQVPSEGGPVKVPFIPSAGQAGLGGSIV